MSVKLLTEHHFEFLSLTGCFTGSSEATLVKIPNCWKSRVTAHIHLKMPFCWFCHAASLVLFTAMMTADPNLMNKLVDEEQKRVKLMVDKFLEMMKNAQVVIVFSSALWGPFPSSLQ